MIYEILASDSEWKPSRINHWITGPSKSKGLEILGVCRRVRLEAREIFYANTTLVFDIKHMTAFVNPLMRPKAWNPVPFDSPRGRVTKVCHTA